MSKLTAFVSSTVKDFGPLRRDLREWFAVRGIEVRTSEHNDFPVAPGVHSHDACLRAIQGANLFVVLIGNRYGGRYKNTPKSITWREYDEAFDAHIPVVALVQRSTNDLVQALAAADKPRKPKPGEEPPRDFDKIAKFIDHVRKGHRDNWTYLDWDGSLTGAAEILQNTINNLFVEYQTPHRSLIGGIERELARAMATRDVARAGHELSAAVRRKTVTVEDALATLLRMVAGSRRELLGFELGEQWNFMIYRLKPSELQPWVRECDPKIERHSRAWKVGEGHVGLSVKTLCTLVAGDLALADGFVPNYPTDTKTYRSAISMPLCRPGGKEAVGAFVVTSNRLDHFLSPGQVEVLTAEQIGSMLAHLCTLETES